MSSTVICRVINLEWQRVIVIGNNFENCSHVKMIYLDIETKTQLRTDPIWILCELIDVRSSHRAKSNIALIEVTVFQGTGMGVASLHKSFWKIL